MNSWGFIPQKPKKKAYEQNDKVVKNWLQEEYPSIVKRAKKEGAEVQWGDETGIRNTSQYGRSYAPKGKTARKRNYGQAYKPKYDFHCNKSRKVQVYGI